MTQISLCLIGLLFAAGLSVSTGGVAKRESIDNSVWKTVYVNGSNAWTQAQCQEDCKTNFNKFASGASYIDHNCEVFCGAGECNLAGQVTWSNGAGSSKSISFSYTATGGYFKSTDACASTLKSKLDSAYFTDTDKWSQAACAAVCPASGSDDGGDTPSDPTDDGWSDGESDTDGRNHMYWLGTATATNTDCTKAAPCQTFAAFYAKLPTLYSPGTIHIGTGSSYDISQSFGDVGAGENYIITGQGMDATSVTLSLQSVQDPNILDIAAVDGKVIIQKISFVADYGYIGDNLGTLILKSVRFSTKTGSTMPADAVIGNVGSLEIEKCEFKDINLSPAASVILTTVVDQTHLKISDSVFSNINTTEPDGEGTMGGAAISSITGQYGSFAPLRTWDNPGISISSTSFKQCNLIKNAGTTDRAGGALYLHISSSTPLSFTDVKFQGNTAEFGNSVCIIPDEAAAVSRLTDSSLWSGLVYIGGSVPNNEFVGWNTTADAESIKDAVVELSGPTAKAEGGSGDDDDDDSNTTVIIIVVVVVVVVVLAIVGVVLFIVWRKKHAN